MAVWLLLPALLAIQAGCGGEKLDRRYTDYRADIVTYLGNSAGGARFELLRRGDSTALQLAGDAPLGETFRAGQRVLLRYDWADPAASAGDHRDIIILAVSAIISDSLRYTVRPLAHYLPQMEAVKLLSIWRTGGWLNLRCQAEYTGKPRQFYLLLDSATRQCDTVHCYLINNTQGDTTYHWRDAYASFYVGNIWNRPTCRAIDVHLNDASNPEKKEYFFSK